MDAVQELCPEPPLAKGEAAPGVADGVVCAGLYRLVDQDAVGGGGGRGLYSALPAVGSELGFEVGEFPSGGAGAPRASWLACGGRGGPRRSLAVVAWAWGR